MLLATLLLAVAAAASPAQEALRLYEAEKYAEARPLLEGLAARGEADGPMLYRLAFTLRNARDPGDRAAFERAAAKLQEEAAGSARLEPAFYLSNAYRNLDRPADSRAAAAAAAQRVESGAMPEPVEPLERFRLGKLYEDLAREQDAARWYALALDGLSAKDSPAYVRWAARYTAATATARGAWKEAERALRHLQDAGIATVDDLDRLARACGRQGRWAEAAEAWRGAENLDRVNADRPRYAARVASLAAQVGILPLVSPDGRSWEALGREELETLMGAQATAVRAAKDAVAAAPGDGALRSKQSEAIASAKSLLASAAVEYVLRDLPLRETAFSGGWAPLLFQPSEWELPPAP
ncbi:MAG TPA: hypothetical protein VFV75_20610 [Candidatus Polarisedimenticolaceae bacterium]|nr:hypothetical protein [Candidatus Polarisedimenticolaceae bacterium]